MGIARKCAERVKEASKELAFSSTAQRNEALQAISEELKRSESKLLEANEKDLVAGKAQGISESLLDRLALSPERIDGICEGISQVIALPDPLEEVLDRRHLPNGIELEKRRVPFGAIGIIYEARPNVTVDAATLCLKAGNAC